MIIILLWLESSSWKFVEFIESDLRQKSMEFLELNESVYQKYSHTHDAVGSADYYHYYYYYYYYYYYSNAYGTQWWAWCFRNVRTRFKQSGRWTHIGFTVNNILSLLLLLLLLLSIDKPMWSTRVRSLKSPFQNHRPILNRNTYCIR